MSFPIFLNLIHLFSLFIPVYIYFVPINYIKHIFKYIFIIILLIPIHWVFFDDRCVLTLFTQEQGGLKNVETESPFSEVYLKWLYKPIMDIIGWKWDSVGIDKMSNLHIGINIFLLWYFLFFVGKCKLI